MTDSFTTDDPRDCPSPIRVLLVVHHEPLARAIQQGLEEEGYEVDVCVDDGGPITVDGYAAVIIDLLRSEDAGLKLLQRLRCQSRSPRVLVLSRPGHAVAEADLSLPAPFAFDDVLVWLRSVTLPPANRDLHSGKLDEML